MAARNGAPTPTPAPPKKAEEPKAPEDDEFAAEAAEPEASTSPEVAALRYSVVEVDATGKALRKFGGVVPIREANPRSIGNAVRLTVESIVGVPNFEAPRLQPESIEG
jgi:hypothetical protein